VAQREAARLVKLASEGRLSPERETLGGLLDRWLDHIEARGRAPKTLVENRRLATAITAELGEKELRKVTGRDLDASTTGCSDGASRPRVSGVTTPSCQRRSDGASCSIPR
jgi:hypothetical protein